MPRRTPHAARLQPFGQRPRTIAASDGEAVPDDASWVDLNQPTAGGRPRRRGIPQGKPSDPRRDRGDRILEPLLCRGRRGLHDRDGADRGRHQQAGACPVHHRRRRRRRIATLRYEDLRALQAISRPRHQAGQRLRHDAGGVLRADRGDRRPHRRRAGEDQRRRRPHQPGDLRPAGRDEAARPPACPR